VDNTAGRYPATPMLLVRQAVLADDQEVASLLRDVPVNPRKVADLIRQRGVFVLADITLPLSARPVAAAVVRYDRAARTAQLVGIGVLASLRRRGLGSRLLTGVLTFLRAEGFERVYACAGARSAGASLLVASAGFARSPPYSASPIRPAWSCSSSASSPRAANTGTGPSSRPRSLPRGAAPR
jgi:N-acetylglutamate synthase-like GNAT family acetyltransferase